MQDPLHFKGAAHRRPVLACSSAGSDYAAFRAAFPAPAPAPVVVPVGSRGDASVFRVDFGPIAAACVVLIAILMLLSPPCAAVLVCVLAGWFARELVAARAHAREDSLPPATDDTRHGALPARGVGGKM